MYTAPLKVEHLLEGKFKIFVQDFFPIGSVKKSSAARFSHKNLVEKVKIFVQDFVTIKTGVSIKTKGNINKSR